MTKDQLKNRSRRRYHVVVAQNFLRNISLDGSHTDTALRIFNQPGLPCSVERVDPPVPNAQLKPCGQLTSEDDPPPLLTSYQVNEDAGDRLVAATASYGVVPTITEQLTTCAPTVDKRLVLSADDAATVGGESAVAWRRGSDAQHSVSSDDDESAAGGDVATASRLSSRHSNTLKSSFSHHVPLKGKRSFLQKIGNLLTTGSSAQTVDSQANGPEDDQNVDDVNDPVCDNASPLKGEHRFLKTFRKIGPRDDRSDRGKNHHSCNSLEQQGIRPIELAASHEISYGDLLVPYRLPATRLHIARTLNASLTGAHTSSANVPTTRFLSSDAATFTPTLPALFVPTRVKRASSCEPSRRDMAEGGEFLFDDIAEEIVDHDFTTKPNSHDGHIRHHARTVQYDGAAKDADSSSDDEETSEGGDRLCRTYGGGDFGAKSGDAAGWLYDPNLTYDPQFGVGQHKTTLKFPGYLTSIIEYADKNELKKQINEKFKQKFPNVQITFSKFKSLKREMKLITLEECLETMVLAHAYVFFEKLVFKTQVSKVNRKLVAGSCLLLAGKLNDVRGEKLVSLIARTESRLRVKREELLAYELPSAVALDFSLHVPDWEIYPHYQRLSTAHASSTATDRATGVVGAAAQHQLQHKITAVA